MAITLREGLGRKLTIAEMDENFLFLSSSYVVNSITGSMTASFADSATTASQADSATTASQADNATSASVAGEASVLSADATASYADSATTASQADLATTASQADRATSASIADDIKTGLIISASEIDVTGNMSVAGTASFAYLQSITGSTKIIGDAFIQLNTDSPAQRYAGFKVIDSGSTLSTASFVFDSENNDFKYEYSGSTHDHAIFLTGPEMSDLSGSTVGYPVSESVLVGLGNHHVTGSLMSISDGVVTVAGTITETSALRYKENVQPINDSLSKVIQLNPVEYDWKRDGKHDLGLIAEEVNEILPDLVSKKGRWVQGISYSRLTTVLIGAVQELAARVQELENK